MDSHWTLRWLLMLIIFALCTMAFSSYAGATSDDTTDDPSTILIN